MKIQPGMKFGLLTVIKDSGLRQNRKILWECECGCQNHTHINVRSDALTTGNTKSCGCSKKNNTNRRVNLTNKRHGHITALYLHPQLKKYNQNLIWICKCDCGRLLEVSTANFYNINSCGKCLNQSFGQEKISQLLEINNIDYQQEKTFNTCRFPKTHALARFDFYVNNKYLIEFDGKQHFQQDKNSNWQGLDYIRAHDEIKNQWCKDNNIPLIRIPYTHLQDLCLEDLQLETSKFII